MGDPQKLDFESVNEAWRYLILTESELENKLAPTLEEHASTNPRLYH